MSKLVPNSPNGEHCSTCRFRVEIKMPPDVTYSICHGGPPAVYLVENGRRCEFPHVNTSDPNFWCGLYRKRARR